MHLISPIQAHLFRRIFENICNPVFLLFLSIFVLIVYVWIQKNPLIIKCIATIAAMLLVVLSTPWLPRYLVDHLQNRYDAVKQVDAHVRWVVVLGGGLNEVENLPIGEALASSSMKRVMEGLRILSMLPDAKIVFSGGSMQGEPTRSIGERMHEYAAMFATKKMNDEVESESINTAQEVVMIKELVHQDSFYLVTSALHMPRSMQLFQHAGMHPIAAPCDYIYFWRKSTTMPQYIPGVYNLAYFNKAWHEWLGMFWGRLRHLM